MNKRQEGSEKENDCVNFLLSNGVSVICQNYRNRTGEIDIIGRDGKYLVFFEVKYRKDTGAGYAETAVNKKKQKIICRVSDYYRMKEGISDDAYIRYDVLAINGDNINWYKNAFDYI